MLKQKLRWFFLPVLGAVIIFSSVFSVLTPTMVSANTEDLPNLLYNDELYKKVSAHQHYWWLYACFKNIDIGETNSEEVDNWDFFQSGPGNTNSRGEYAALGAMYDGNADEYNNAFRNCEDESIVKTAMEYVGVDTSQPLASRKAFCSISGANFDGRTGNDCIAGSGGGDWDNDSGRTTQVDWLKSRGKDPGLGPEGTYLRAYSSLIQGCEIKFVDDTQYNNEKQVPGADDGSNGTTYAVPIVVPAKADAKKTEVKYVQGTGVGGDSKVYLVSNSNESSLYTSNQDAGTNTRMLGSATYVRCNDLVNTARANAAAYSKYIDQNGYDSASDSTGGGSSSTEAVCSAGALGWVICPAMSLMVDVVNWVASVLQGYLAFNPFSGGGNDIKKVWSSLLGVANILLVIAFLVVIFSQATSFGLTSYGIKRILPRIIAAAILMNLSYYICQILVDISNIAGVGISSFVSSVTGNSFSDNIAQVGDLSKIVVGTGIIAIVAFFFLIPVLLAFLAIIFTIAARNAIIVLLVIVAPLAFAAWILPNTEKYFKKWWELLVNMLLLFPAVMLVFSASVVAANVISSSTPPDAPGGQDLQSIIALLVLALPLFAMPLMFKAAGGALDKINDLTKRNARTAGKSLKDRYDNSEYGKYRKSRKQEDRRLVSTGSYNGWRPDLRGRSVFNRQANRNAAFNRVTRGYGGHRMLDESRQSAEDRKRTQDMLANDFELAQAWVRSGGDRSHASYADLSRAQQVRFDQMQAAGYNRRANSFTAAQEVMADSGVGTEDDVQATLNHIARLSPNRDQAATAQAGLTESIRAVYRGKGRGDLVTREGNLHTGTGLHVDGFTPGLNDQGWSEVNMSSLSRHALDNDYNPQGRASFQRWVQQDEEHLRSVVTALDSMEGRARTQAETALAQIGYTDIEALRVQFGLRR